MTITIRFVAFHFITLLAIHTVIFCKREEKRRGGEKKTRGLFFQSTLKYRQMVKAGYKHGV